MKIEDPRSVISSPSLHPAAPGTPASARTEARRPQSEVSAASQPAARVEISPRSRELTAAMEAAQAAPDVRTDKVNDARQRISQGTYTVNAEAVARRILDTTA